MNELIIGIHGDRGSGKSYLMTVLGLYFSLKGFNILTNYWVKFAHASIDINKFDEMHDSVILFDQLESFYDSRDSMTKKNKTFSYFIGQLRKRSISFIYTTQFRGEGEKRVREKCDYYILCESTEDSFDYSVFKNKITGEDFHTSFSIEKNKAGRFFGYYDTKQIIKPVFDFKNPKTIDEIYNED